MRGLLFILAVWCVLLTGCGADKRVQLPEDTSAAPAAELDYNQAENVSDAPQDKGGPAPPYYRPAPITLPDGEVTGEITVMSYYDNNYLLDMAIELFEAKYPGTKVNVEKFEVWEHKTVEMDGYTLGVSEPIKDEQAETDYIKRLNTQIMSGGGPDILKFDIVPYYKYADADYLVDLRQYMEQDLDFNALDYAMNVMDACLYKNGQYIMPVSYSFNFFARDAGLITDIEKKDAYTFGELMDKAAAFYTGDNYIFGMTGDMDTDYHGVWDLFLEENYAAFVDIENKKAYFDDGRFENLLLSITEYNDKGYLYQWEEGEGYIERSARDERFFFKYKVYDSLLQHFVKDIGDINANLRASMLPYGNQDNDEYIGLTAAHNGGILFKARHSYALNSNSNNKRSAWEFLKFLTSYEIQSQTEIGGVPVNKTAFNDNAACYVGYFTSELKGDTRFNEYLTYASELADKVNTCVLRDYRIDQMIKDEVTQYFNGKKSAKDVSLALQGKIRLYLSE